MMQEKLLQKKRFANVQPNYKVMENIDRCEFVATQQSPGDALVRSSRHFGTPTSRINNKILTYPVYVSLKHMDKYKIFDDEIYVSVFC